MKLKLLSFKYSQYLHPNQAKEKVMAEQKVTVKALCVLRDAKGKKVQIGRTLEVLKSTADILVKNKQAELVEIKK